MLFVPMAQWNQNSAGLSLSLSFLQSSVPGQQWAIWKTILLLSQSDMKRVMLSDIVQNKCSLEGITTLANMSCITVKLRTDSFEFISHSCLLGYKSVKAAHSTHGPLLCCCQGTPPCNAAFGFWASFHFQFSCPALRPQSPSPFLSKQSYKG